MFYAHACIMYVWCIYMHVPHRFLCWVSTWALLPVLGKGLGNSCLDTISWTEPCRPAFGKKKELFGCGDWNLERVVRRERKVGRRKRWKRVREIGGRWKERDPRKKRVLRLLIRCLFPPITSFYVVGYCIWLPGLVVCETTQVMPFSQSPLPLITN